METNQEVRKKRVRNSDVQSAKSELLDTLVKDCKTEADLFGPEGVFTELKGALMQRLLEAEMSEHLG
jgi:hypothetical protein